MKISLPLVVLDLETTGTWVERDKIIEIGMLKCLPGGGKEQYLKRVNPGFPIPVEITELTGISDAAVANAPGFKEIAAEVFSFIGDADLGGFNLKRFDLPLLKRELFEAGIAFEWEKHTVYDAQEIYHMNEKRDLTAAYQFYCHKDLVNAHSALGDVEATLAVLEEQVKLYGAGSNELHDLKNMSYQRKDNFYDDEHKFCWWNGQLYMMFGKYAKKKDIKEIAKSDPGYLKWILTSDFSDTVKTLVKEALAGKFPERINPEQR